MTDEHAIEAPPQPTPEGSAGAARALRWYIAAVVAVGFVTLGVSVAWITEAASFPLVVAIAATIALGDLPIVHVRHGDENHSFTWSEATLVAGLVLLPAWWIPLVGAPVIGLQHLLRHRPVHKAAFNAAGFAIAAFVATAVHELLAMVLPGSWETLALGVACLVYFAVNLSSVSMAVALAQQERFRSVLSSGIELASLFTVANASLAILVALAAEREPIVLLVIPPVVVQLLFVYRNTREVIRERDLWYGVQELSASIRLADAPEVGQTAVTSVADLTSAEVVELVTVEDDRARIVRLADGRVAIENAPASAADDVWGRAECDRSPFWLDRRSAPTRQQAWLRERDVRFELVLPLEFRSTTVGLLRLGFRDEPEARDRIVAALSTVANQIATTVTSHEQTATLAHRADHDQLTGLPNRARLLRHLEAALRSAHAGVAVLFFDLDDFKIVNDSLGHHAGDELLLEVTRRLREQMRGDDVVGRFGGDEFIVVCQGVNTPDDAEQVARRLLDALASPDASSSMPTSISASVGVAFLPRQACLTADPKNLLRDADAAMYAAKRQGAGSLSIFSEGLCTRVIDRHELEQSLQETLRDDGIEVHYQPIVDTGTGEIVELEALARWQHAQRGSVPPDVFIAVAEETGQIKALGARVLRRACADMRTWIDLGLAPSDLRVAVNLSAQQLDATLPAVVADALNTNRLPASRLTLEVTESALVDGPDAIESLHRLRTLGVRVSLDDFGTGYSSLAALHDLPVDTVKVDRTFVKGLGEDRRTTDLVAGIANLVHALGMLVVAEGVETAAQSEIVAALGCDRAQGWLHGRPTRPALVEALLAGVAPDEPQRPRRTHLRVAT